MCRNIWIYTNYEICGFVFANSEVEAKQKLGARYNANNFVVWNIENDTCYNSKHPDVLECF